MALSADRNTTYRDGVEVDVLCAAATVIYAGGLVCINPSTGLLVMAADTATYLLAGVAMEAKAVTSANQYVRVRRKGLFSFAATSIEQAHVGSMMYVKDDQTFDNTSSNLVPCGRLVKLESATLGWIDIEPATLGTYNISVDGFIDLMPALTLEDGTAVTKYSTGGATPGWQQLSSKEVVLTWDGNATHTAVAAKVSLPPDLDGAAAVTVHWLAKMAGGTDTPVIVHECYFGAGDTDCAGTDDEIDGGTTLTEYIATIAHGDVPDGPANLTVIFQPTNSQMTTDECYIYACWLEFTRVNAA